MKPTKILTFLLSLGPKLPQAIAILRALAWQAAELINLFPEGLPSLAELESSTFTEDELTLEAKVLVAFSEHTKFPMSETGSLLKMLLLLDRSGVDNVIAWVQAALSFHSINPAA